jgi:Holliday junction resolvase
MPNANYVKGRRKEYKVMNAARERGLIALRSAGSHSPIDVVTIDVDQREIRLIQCKPESMSENQKQAIREENNLLNGIFRAKFEVI